MMWIALAAATIIAACVGSYALVQSVRRRPFGAALALSAAVLISLEAVLLHLLSPMGGAGRASLLIGNWAIAGAGLLVHHRHARGARLAPPLRFVARGMHLAWIAPLGLVAASSAIEFVPNNFDSMTYHLARVVYWLQNGSVEPYPTNILRQVVHPPGAEYLLLALQAIARSDRLANMVQLTAWAMLVFAAPPLVRSFGAPRRVAGWAGVLMGTIPVGLLEASSTQNDLVATLMGVAIVLACLPFLHGRRSWQWHDLLLLGATGAGGLLVKPTALVVAAPVVVWAFFAACRSLRERRDWIELGRGAGAGLAILLAAAAPAMLTWLSVPDSSSVTEGFVYPGVAEPLDRLVNALRGFARQMPLPDRLTGWLAPPTTRGCPSPNSLCSQFMFEFQEDFVGNIGHAFFATGSMLLGAFRWRGLPQRSRLALASLPAGWLLFHALFRDNIWLTRLQLPLFGLGVLVLVAFGARRGRRALSAASLPPILMLLVAYGALTVSRNLSRPPSLDPRAVAFDASSAAYYMYAPKGVEEAHASAVKALRATGCRRLGMYIGGDSYDYPLAWRAVQDGVEVRHVVAPDAWPCLVFSDLGMPPPRPSGESWRALTPFVFVSDPMR